MKYFIPAWYSQQPMWHSEIEETSSTTAFDDMISLMSMHHQNEQPFQLIVLNYKPNLRTFLHRYELFDTTYWSVFDEIQGFQHATPKAVDYRQLDWPKGTEFIYLPAMIRALMPDDRYANIRFSQEGYVSSIDVYQSETKQYRYIVDDRGFVSRIDFYNKVGTHVKQQYLTHTGDWILEVEISSGEVTVHAPYQSMFSQSHYPSMETVIFEYVTSYRNRTFEQQDVVVIAADVRHNEALAQTFSSYNRCYSVFQQRFQSGEQLQTLDQDASWLVDTLENEQRLARYRVKHQLTNRLMRITPFDAQTLPNISSQLHETYVGLWIDGLADARLDQILEQLADYMRRDTALRLTLLTRCQKYTVPQWLTQKVDELNVRLQQPGGTLEAVRELMKEDEPTIFVELKSVPFELDVIEALATLRVMIDLSYEPDLFLQISCLSAGLPQINMRATDYVRHQMNGMVLENDTALSSALDYYLQQLKNWNQSYAYAMKLGKQYASDKIIAQLDALIEGESNGA